MLAAWLIHARPSWGAASADSLGGMLAGVERCRDLRQRVSESAERLHASLPTAAPAEQEVRVREALGRLAESNGMQLGALKRLERSTRMASAQTAIDLQLELTGQYEPLIRFINALENDRMPFQVADLRVEAGQAASMGGGGGGGGRGGGGGERQFDGNIRCSMKVRGYVFPRVFAEAKPKGPSDGMPGNLPGGGMPAPSTMRGMSEPPGMAPPPRPNDQKTKPSPAPSAEKAPAANHPHRKIIRAEGREVIIEGNKVTADGQTIELSPHDLEELQKQIPAGAEVIEE